MHHVYLAGPEVFLPDAHDIGEQKKKICQKFGFRGLFPLDKELDLEGQSAHARAVTIYEANVDLIRRSDLVIANLTPFRGPSMDVGTAFEIGFATALSLPVFGYTNSSERLIDRVNRAEKDILSVRPTDLLGMEIENFGFFENLMIEVPILEAAGAVVSGTTSERDRFTDLSAFEHCVERAAKHFTNISPRLKQA